MHSALPGRLHRHAARAAKPYRSQPGAKIRTGKTALRCALPAQGKRRGGKSRAGEKEKTGVAENAGGEEIKGRFVQSVSR